jgi:gamma-carbonic anhydrase
MKPIIINYFDKKPKIDPQSFIAPGASIIGDVTIGANVSIWFSCVIRGDVEPVTIGNNTNIQDGTVIHVTRNGFPTNIGSYVTVGHKALLHACTINDYAFIGMGAIIMDNVVIETNAMVAAGALVTPNKRVKSGELWAGSPAKFMRMLTDEEIEHIKISADNYSKHAAEYNEILAK